MRFCFLFLVAATLLMGLVQLAYPAPVTPDPAFMNQQSFKEFDQDMDTGWRVLELQMQYTQAVDAIRAYEQANAARLQPWQRASLEYHLAHMYALEGDKQRSIEAFNRVLASDALGNSAYVQASIAFLSGDREALLRDRQTIATSNPGPWQKGDLVEVDAMLKYFGQPFEAVFASLTCVDKTLPISGPLWPAYCDAMLKKYAAVYQIK